MQSEKVFIGGSFRCSDLFVTVSMIPTAFAVAGSYTITFSAGDKGTLKQALYDSLRCLPVTRTASGNIKIERLQAAICPTADRR